MRVVIVNKQSFSALKRVINALRNYMGQVRLGALLIIQALLAELMIPLIVCHNHCIVALIQEKKVRTCLKPLGLTEAKDIYNLLYFINPRYH